MMQAFSKSLTALTLLFLSCAAHTLAYASEEEARFYESVAYNYVNAHFKNLPADEKAVIRVDKVNPERSFGGRCEGYLTAEITGGELRNASTVKIVCSRPEAPFTLYVPVRITLLRATLVAARNLSAGSILSENDIRSEFLEQGRTISGAISLIDSLIGARVKREVREGEIFQGSNLCTVCKGDRVLIEAKSGNLSLKTSGEALEDGNAGETVRVRNLKTRKVILSTVTGAGEVTVIL